jgi:probable rRNA maturation factor
VHPKTADALVIDVTDRQKCLKFDAAWLSRVVRRVLEAEVVAAAELGILLVDDRAIARLHAKWLGVPGPTDVITFDLGSGPGPELRGDIAVSTETARRAARELGWQPRHEVAYYVVHGILHLTGYDDHSPADRRAMRARERAVMAAAGLPRPPRRRPAASRKGRGR